ncbi:MAG: hypothetical protein WCP06_14420, partial [Verrucomicrobiota bacterium]
MEQYLLNPKAKQAAMLRNQGKRIKFCRLPFSALKARPHTSLGQRAALKARPHTSLGQRPRLI